MALVHHDSREVQFKIVYCGPPMGGKTSNLQYIHRRLDPRWRGDLVSIATEQNRTISFDYLPIHSSEIGGYETRFQLFAVPGQDVMQETRKAVLAGADAVVFVADSSAHRMRSNAWALEDTKSCLRSNGLDPRAVPMVFQFNKRDLPDAVSPCELDELLGVDSGSFLACAQSGYQIFATLDRAVQLILSGFHRSFTGSRVNPRLGVAPNPRHLDAAETLT